MSAVRVLGDILVILCSRVLAISFFLFAWKFQTKEDNKNSFIHLYDIIIVILNSLNLQNKYRDRIYQEVDSFLAPLGRCHNTVSSSIYSFMP